MISPGFYPLAVGLAITSALIAYSDLRHGWMYYWHWIPGILGVGIFYGLSLNIPLLFLALGTSIIMVGATWATLRFIHRRNQLSAVVGGGDYIAVALFSFWPEMIVSVMMVALMFGVAGFHWNWWNRGLRGIPLAGLMGLFCIVYIAWIAIA